MAYNKTPWQNGSGGGTAVNNALLNKIEEGIDEAHVIAETARATALATAGAAGMPVDLESLAENEAFSGTFASLSNRPVNVMNRADPLLNAVNDGTTHPLSERFASLGEAQAVFPHVTALSQEIDWAAIQSALNENGSTYLPGGGGYVTTDELEIPANNVNLFGDGPGLTRIVATLSAGEAAIKGGSSGLYTLVGIKDLLIYLTGTGAYGINWTKFSYSRFTNIHVDLRTADQVGFYGAGNGLGTGPYYNAFDRLVIGGFGEAAFRLASGGGGFTADGPNANTFNDILRCYSLEKFMDIQAGNGNTGTNLSLESITDVGFDFNNRSPVASGTATAGSANSLTDSGAAFGAGVLQGTLRITGGTGAGYVGFISARTATVLTLEQSLPVVLDNTSTYEVYEPKAQKNRFTQVRQEGASGCVPVYFRYGALDNQVTGDAYESLGTAVWHNDSASTGNWVSYKNGAVIPFTFQATNLAASTTTQLAPVGGSSSGAAGGWRVPYGSKIHAISTSMDGFGSSGAGAVTIKMLRSGTEMTALTHILNVNNRFGYYLPAATPGASTDDMKFRNIRVTATTDGSWDQTSADVFVTVWLVL